MIVNGLALLRAAPITDMLTEKVSGQLSSHGLAEAGYDIRLKQTVNFTTHFNGHARVPVIKVGDGENSVVTHNGRFVLASTIEHFQMPCHLVGVVHDKSTWARRGLSVFNTVIEPGWHGYLTLELVYHGADDLIIPAGTGIAQVLFHDLQHGSQYNGKYQGQENKPVPAR